MLEIPEVATLARQIDETWIGRTITTAEAGHSKHGFACYLDDPAWYGDALMGQRIDGVRACAGHLDILIGPWCLSLSDGALPRRLAPDEKRPAKHQLLVEFDDGSALMCTIQMYGGIALFEDGEFDNPYYLAAVRAPSPLTGAFRFDMLRALAAEAKPTLSAKALLATEQRIPGLGNGCLQDILFTAGVHPQRRVSSLDDTEFAGLYSAMTEVLQAMTNAGGRDTEKDLFGQPGGYHVQLSAKTLDLPCPKCHGPITRKAYLGGNVYFCLNCQPR